MMNKEPALLVAVVVALLQFALRQMDVYVENEALEGVVTGLLVILGGVLVRRKVFSEDTIRRAGLSPEAVEAAAEDPAVPAHRGE